MTPGDRRNVESSERPEREHQPNGNGGNNLTFKWLAGLLLGALVLVTTAWVRGVNDRMDRGEKEQADARERMVRIEASQVRMESDVEQILQRLNARERRP